MAIYDAALSDDHWPRALDAFSKEISALGAILVAVDQVGLPFRIEQASSLYGLERVRYYFEAFGHFDEPVMSQRLARTPPGQLLRDCDVWGDMRPLEDRPDYKWLREQVGARRRAGIRLSANKGWMDLLALQFDRDWTSFPAGRPSELETFIPHLAKVVEVNRKFSILREHYGAVLAALDYIRIGTCIVAQTGHVILSNREAQRICGLDDGLTVSRTGFLSCLNGDATAKLTVAIRAIASTAGGKGSEHEAVFHIQRRSGSRSLMIEIAPLRDTLGELQNGLEGAIVFIVDPENHNSISTERLSNLFSLSEAEADVARHMVGGLSAAEIAEVRGVTEETVKSQFKAIYSKTGVRRRADLVRLALAVDPPIDRGPKRNP
jgi:DNA-binding CsgD family transcriptional regulator